MSNPSPSIVIKKLRVRRTEGGLALNLEGLRRGLNVVRGDNSSGRTTLLQLFEFGLGANLRQSDFIPEIKDACDFLLLEVELNGVAFTITRKFYGASNIEVYQGEIDTPLRNPSTILSAGREFSEFLLRRFRV